MNNILLFRGRTSAAALPAIRLLPAKTVSSVLSAGHSRRPTLIAVWHTDPRTGKMECRWTTEEQAICEDGDSPAWTHRLTA